MSTIITKDNTKILLKYIGLGMIFILGMIISIYLIKMIFNLGIYLGTFMRNAYNLVCYA